MKHLFFSLFVFCCLFKLNLSVHAQNTSFKVVGYFPNWSDMVYDIDQLDCSMLTHINWAFQNPDANGNLIESDYGLDKLMTKAQKSGVQVLVSIGGGAASSGTTKTNYFNLISTKEKRGLFIHKILTYVEKHHLHGVDVDLEGPAINANYDAFIQQLYDSLHPKQLLLTAALNGDATDNFKNQTIPLFDWINIMSYDATGSWTPDNPGQHASYEYALNGIEKWMARGALREQLISGVPFYGHAFYDLINLDYWNYNQIIKKYPDAYQYDERGNVIYYNGIPTIQKKTYLALDRAGGIMIWALSYDVYNEYSLLKAIDDARKNYNPNDQPPLVTFLSPKIGTEINQTPFEVYTAAIDSDGIYNRTRLNIEDRFYAESITDTTIFQVKNLSDGIYEFQITAYDHQNRFSSQTQTIQVIQIERTPYNNIVVSIPGIIQAENYDIGANQRTFYDNGSKNEGNAYRFDAVDIESCNDTGGGYDIGWSAAGEWLEYSVQVDQPGIYTTDFRIASPNTGKKFHIEMDGKNISGSISVPNTGNWQVWQTVKSPSFELTKGSHILRFCFDTDGFNLNYLKFNLIGTHSSQESMDQSSIRVFPNPMKDQFTIEYNQPEATQIHIFNISGQLMKTEQLLKGQPQTNIDVQNWPSGYYNLKITSAHFNQSMLLVKIN